MLNYDYDILYLVDLGFSQGLTKRLSYKLHPLVVCPPCGPLDWYWSIDCCDGTYHKLKTPRNKQEVKQLLEWFNFSVDSPHNEPTLAETWVSISH